MNRLLVLILFLASATTRAQQPSPKPFGEDSAANVITYWKTGDIRLYTILHERTIPQPNQKDLVVHFVYEARVTVLDATDTDYTIKWVWHVPPGVNKTSLGAVETFPFFEGMQIIYRISNSGGFLELINWEEVRDHYAQFMNFPKESFSTRTSVESALIREIQLYHLPFGYTFTTTKVSSNTHLSNPFGGSPLPAIQSYQLTASDPVEFTLVVQQGLDKARLNSSLESLLKKIKDDRQRQQQRQQLTSLELSDYTEYRIVRYTGWIKHLYYKRAAVGEGITQSDAYTIDQKE